MAYIFSVESFVPWFDNTLGHPLHSRVQAPHALTVNLIEEGVARDRVRRRRVRMWAVAVSAVGMVLVAAM